VLPLIPRLGFGFLAGVLVVVVFLVLRMRPSARPTEGPLRPGGLGGPRAGAHPHEHDTKSYGGGRSESTTRTILTTSVAEQRANRARRSDSHDEPTIEWHSGDQKPPPSRPTTKPEQPSGKWWSGQPDEDEDTTQNQSPWAEEPTEERNRGSLFNRHPGTKNPRHPPR
jgi:hypothetical protein